MTRILKNNTLSASQRRCAEKIAYNGHEENLSLKEISEEVGVHERTIYRWKQDPEFVEYTNALSDRAMEDSLSEAYQKLKHLMREGKSEKTQLEALKLILQNRGKLKDTHEHTHEVKENGSLEDLRREALEMENELLEE